MLRAIKEANTNLQPDLIATCLAAHIVPKKYGENHSAYLDEIVTHLFPTLKKEHLFKKSQRNGF